MNVIWQSFYQGYAPATATTVFTSNASKYGRVAVKDINLSNNGYTAVRVWVWGLPSGITTPTDAYLIIPGWTLPATTPNKGGSSRQWTGFHVLHDGDSIVVQATPGNAVSVQVMGGYQK